jgi:Tim44-like domain
MIHSDALFDAMNIFGRPGGGQSYSGSHSSSGGGGGGYSGGGGGGGGGIWLLLNLCISYPQLGIPVLIILVIVFVVRARAGANQAERGWASQDLSSVMFSPAEEMVPVAATQGVPRRALARIRENDPEFSIVLFEDFLYTLYAEMMRARGQQGAMALSAYLGPAVQQVLAAKSLKEVSGIVIGAMRVFSIDRTQTSWRVTLDFEANLTEATQRLYVVDRITVERNLNAKSRPANRSRTLDCPNCGAPLNALRGDVCSYCKQQVGMGKFDWSVVYFERLKSENRGPLLTTNVDEDGGNTPTVVDPEAQNELARLRSRDPSFDWAAFTQRVALAFSELQIGWSGRDLSRVRPFVSDNLLQAQAYWIDLYIQARARNITEGAQITRVDLANVLSDSHFDAITIRLFATSTDYTISDDGKLLSGNKSRQRAYSEYWTLIRGAGKTGPTKTTPNCPHCGAPLKVNQAGTCAYCQVKVTTGEFDWVLSRIEQDDSYTG